MTLCSPRGASLLVHRAGLLVLAKVQAALGLVGQRTQSGDGLAVEVERGRVLGAQRRAYGRCVCAIILSSAIMWSASSVANSIASGLIAGSVLASDTVR